MDYFYVITNREKDAGLATTRRVADYLEKNGKHCLVREFQNQEEHQSQRGYTNAKMIPRETQCILVLGGDGTLIQAARDTLERQIPLLGVNLGTLGYLAEIEEGNLEFALDSLMKDRYNIEERMMLEGRVYKDGKLLAEDVALNDIVISRYGSLRVIRYLLYVNGAYLNAYSADGVIAATPTGSTGYSLSAGGPIVSPSASMTILTPICAHTLNTRSIVLSQEDRIRIETGSGRHREKEEAIVTFDGEHPAMLGEGDYVEIQKARQVTKIIKISNVSFLEVLSSKMRETQEVGR